MSLVITAEASATSFTTDRILCTPSRSISRWRDSELAVLRYCALRHKRRQPSSERARLPRQQPRRRLAAQADRRTRALERRHRSQQPQGSSPQSHVVTSPAAVSKTCAGLAAAKYVGRETLRSIIEDHFCPDAVAQGGLDKDSGSISRRYNRVTMDEAALGIDYAHGLDFRPNMPDCVRYLIAELTDGCGGNDPDNDPENYKGGGTMKVGPVAYQIWPQAVRQSAKSGLQGGRDGTYKFLWDEFTMWGHGFASSDSGAALKGQVDDCALLPDTWDFQSGLGSDGMGWTAKFRTGVFQKRCVGQAGKEAGAPGDFGCRGSG